MDTKDESRWNVPGHRKFVTTADDPANLPFGWNDLLVVHGLNRRDDLNRRLATAHGRVKKKTNDLEGLTMIDGGEEIWCRRRNLSLVNATVILKRVCDEHGVSETERAKGLVHLKNGGARPDTE